MVIQIKIYFFYGFATVNHIKNICLTFEKYKLIYTNLGILNASSNDVGK
jgi:hypothetical protein